MANKKGKKKRKNLLDDELYKDGVFAGGPYREADDGRVKTKPRASAVAAAKEAAEGGEEEVEEEEVEEGGDAAAAAGKQASGAAGADDEDDDDSDDDSDDSDAILYSKRFTKVPAPAPVVNVTCRTAYSTWAPLLTIIHVHTHTHPLRIAPLSPTSPLSRVAR